MKEFGNKCFGCGIANRTIALNSEGDIYIVYLHVAHVFPSDYEKTKEDSYIVSLCPKCHMLYDKPPRNDGARAIKAWTLIGRVAAYFIEKESREIERQRAEEQKYLAERVINFLDRTSGREDDRTGTD